MTAMKTITPSSGARTLRSNGQSPTVDQVMAEERATAFAKRSIKTSAKLDGLKLAVSMMDLTTLEGKDTPGKRTRSLLESQLIRTPSLGSASPNRHLCCRDKGRRTRCRAGVEESAAECSALKPDNRIRASADWLSSFGQALADHESASAD